MEVDDSIIGTITEMSRIPAALKAWKLPVLELVNDTKFFVSSSIAAEKWKPIVKALFDADRTAFPELLGMHIFAVISPVYPSVRIAKVATAPTSNIFTSREYEMLLRAINLRRLSFVLLTGEKNHFLTSLPSVQEKIVDTFKNVTSPVVLCEVYLCIRVLLCRLSPHNLTSLWPVILTELVCVTF